MTIEICPYAKSCKIYGSLNGRFSDGNVIREGKNIGFYCIALFVKKKDPESEETNCPTGLISRLNKEDFGGQIN